MIYDFQKLEKKNRKISFMKYDYVLVGTGPSATVLLDYLLKHFPTRSAKGISPWKGIYASKNEFCNKRFLSPS